MEKTQFLGAIGLAVAIGVSGASLNSACVKRWLKMRIRI